MTVHEHDMEREKLKACPWCGKPGKLEEADDHHGEFFSLGCAAGFTGLGDECPGANIFYTAPIEEKERAITAWNTRADTARIAALEGGVAKTIDKYMGAKR